MKTAKILLTGFTPFGGESVNPALEAVKLVKSPLPEIALIKLEVPTVFARSGELVTAAMDKYLPDAVICVGQAAGRSAVTPERIAINVDDARIPDNDGAQPVDKPIAADGPAAYFATLPIKAVVQAIRAAGVPAEVSNSAGTYVCNHLMYAVLHHTATDHPGTHAGFIHVPCIPEQTVGKNIPSLPLDRIVVALEAAITAVI